MSRVVAVTGLALTCLAGSALAQDVGRRLNFQTPSSPNYQPLEIPATEQPYELPPLPPATAEERQISDGARLVLRDIRVEGVTAFTPAQLMTVAAPYLNREVTTAELQSLRVDLTRLYVDNGYVSSGVVLPDQTVTDGVVVFQAYEGTLAGVELVNSPKLRRGYVAGRVARQVDTPLNVTDLQQALRYLQQDPNIRRLDARLAPGEAPGESLLRLSIEDAPRFHAGVGADNHGATSTGGERGSVFFGARNLSGYGDEFRASLSKTDGADEGSAVFSVPLTARNVMLQAYYSQSAADIIEQPFSILDIDSKTTTWGTSLALPLIESLDNRLALSLGFESKESETRVGGLPISLTPGSENGKAETAVALLGLDWVRRGESSVGGVRLTYRRGLDALDATIYEPTDPPDPFCDPADTGGLFDPCNPTGADGEFGLVQAQLLYLKRLNALPGLRGLKDRAQFVFRSTGQFSQDPLLGLEKLAIGGVNTVRGYPENLLIRDNGVAATLELQLPFFGYRPEPHPTNLVLVSFVDYGRSWDERNIDPGSSLRDTEDATYIWSAGLGLLWQPFRGLDMQLYWGADIGDNFGAFDPRDSRTDEDLQDDGIHFAVTYTYRW